MAQPDLLDVRARPRGGQLLIIVVVALAAGAGGTWLTRALDASVQPGWPLALGIGAGIALGVVWFAMQGARVVVAADRVLTYSLHGRPNLACDLTLITAVRPIEAGLVHGIGLELSDPRQVRFLHKAGISPASMRQWREAYGVDVVLEGFPPGLAEELQRVVAGTGQSAG